MEHLEQGHGGSCPETDRAISCIRNFSASCLTLPNGQFVYCKLSLPSGGLQGVCQPQSTPCGALGQSCCLTSQGAQNYCDPGPLICENAHCTACGELGQPCCANNTCTDSACNPATGVCEPCGQFEEPCCPGEAAVQCPGDGYEDLVCLGGTCQVCGSLSQPCCNDANCADPYRQGCTGPPPDGICVDCGTPYQPCCKLPIPPSTNVCDLFLGVRLVCDKNFGPRFGSCLPCGGQSQLCCEDAPQCDSPLSCFTFVDPPICGPTPAPGDSHRGVRKAARWFI